MGPAGVRRHQHWLQSFISGRQVYGPSRFSVDRARPGDASDKRLCGDKLAGLAIEDVEESIL
jgi:hypothetical protein